MQHGEKAHAQKSGISSGQHRCNSPPNGYPGQGETLAPACLLGFNLNKVG
jgi:hypothetical protein